MKKYIAPALEVSSFKAEDIVTVSGGGTVVTDLTVSNNAITPFGGETGYSASDLQWAQ